jgi:glutamate-1-semialdehyde 2,1-aminomutase
MKQAPVEQFEESFPVSRSLYQRALSVIPGGVTRGSIFYRPYPLYAAHGQGCRLAFSDGIEVIDFMNNYTSLVLGHRHPATLSAVRAQLSRGNIFGAPTELEVELAELLVERFASIEKVIFTSTGSEAIMAGIRLARALSGRDGIAKFEGGYHGGYDYAKVSGTVGPDRWGDEITPSAVPDTAGIPDSVTSQVYVMRFNSIESVERVLGRAQGRIAALLVEPVLGAGGMIPATPEFLRSLREICSREGIILLFDEIITARLAPGGAQQLYGVEADLTVISKTMSGGFPIAALGGRADLMSGFDATKAAGPLVYHSGTYNANALSVAASLGTLRAITPETIDQLNNLGEQARSGLRRVFASRKVSASVTGIGSLFNVHFTATAPEEYRAVRLADQDALRALHIRVLGEGIFLAPRGLGCTSAPMGEAEIKELLGGVERALEGVGGEIS